MLEDVPMRIEEDSREFCVHEIFRAVFQVSQIGPVAKVGQCLWAMRSFVAIDDAAYMTVRYSFNR